MIITRENIKEEASNLNDEILNLEKKYGVNIITVAQVESFDTELESDMLELLKALKAERNDNGSKKHLYN